MAEEGKYIVHTSSEDERFRINYKSSAGDVKAWWSRISHCKTEAKTLLKQKTKGRDDETKERDDETKGRDDETKGRDDETKERDDETRPHLEKVLCFLELFWRSRESEEALGCTRRRNFNHNLRPWFGSDVSDCRSTSTHDDRLQLKKNQVIISQWQSVLHRHQQYQPHTTTHIPTHTHAHLYTHMPTYTHAHTHTHTQRLRAKEREIEGCAFIITYRFRNADLDSTNINWVEAKLENREWEHCIDHLMKQEISDQWFHRALFLFQHYNDRQ